MCAHREQGRLAAGPGNESALLGHLSLCEKPKAGPLLLKAAQHLALDASFDIITGCKGGAHLRCPRTERRGGPPTPHVLLSGGSPALPVPCLALHESVVGWKRWSQRTETTERSPRPPSLPRASSSYTTLDSSVMHQLQAATQEQRADSSQEFPQGFVQCGVDSLGGFPQPSWDNAQQL